MVLGKWRGHMRFFILLSGLCDSLVILRRSAEGGLFPPLAACKSIEILTSGELILFLRNSSRFCSWWSCSIVWRPVGWTWGSRDPDAGISSGVPRRDPRQRMWISCHYIEYSYLIICNFLDHSYLIVHKLSHHTSHHHKIILINLLDSDVLTHVIMWPCWDKHWPPHAT